MLKGLPKWVGILLSTIIAALVVLTGRPGFAPLGPQAQILSMAPFNGPKPVPAWDVLQADSILQFLPWRDLVFKSWQNFSIPVWNPYQLCGTPILANSQSGALYPPHIIVGVLHIPTLIGIALLAIFHIFVLTRGIFLLCRELGASRIGANWAALGFSGSAFILNWVALPSVVSTVAWIPWCLYFVAKGKREVAFPLAMMILAGHLQFAAYGMMACVLVTVVLLLKKSLNWKAGLGIALGMGLGLALSAPQLLPVLEYSKTSHRRTTPSEEGYEGYKQSTLQPFELPALITPQVLGNPDKERTVEGLNFPIGDFWPALVKRGSNYAESGVGLGGILLLGLCLGRYRKTSDAVWVGGSLALLGLFLSLPTALTRALYFSFPGWSASGSPARAGVLFLLGGALMASQIKLRGVDPKRYAVPGGVFCALVAVSIVLTRLLAPEAVSSWAASASVLGLLALVAVLVVACQPLLLSRGGFIIGLPVAVLVAVAAAVQLSQPTLPTKLPNSGQSEFVRSATVNDSWNLYQLPKATLPGNLATLYGKREAGGYDSLLNIDTVKLLDSANGAPSAPQENGNMMFIRSSVTLKGLTELGVGLVSSKKELPQLGKPAAVVDDTYNYALAAPTIVSQSGFEKPEDWSGTPGHLEVKIKSDGAVIVRERNIPGWSATASGVRLPLEPGSWLHVNVATGVDSSFGEKIVFDYVPPGMHLGFGLAAGAGTILLLAALIQKKQKTGKDSSLVTSNIETGSG